MISDSEFSNKVKSSPDLKRKLTEFMSKKSSSHDRLVSECQQKMKKNTIISSVVAAVFLILGIIACVVTKTWFLMVFAIIFGGIIAGTTYAVGKNNAKRKYLGSFAPSIIEILYGPKSTYNVVGGFSREYLSDLNLFPVRKLRQEDQIIGQYQGVPFTITDVTSYHEETRSNGKTTTTETVYDFVGSVISIRMNKPAKTPLTLLRGFSLFSGDSIDFESTEFNKLYNCYCQDREQAFYLITPQIQLAILQLTKGIPGSMSFLFRGDELVIAISGNSTEFKNLKLKGKNLNYNINVIIDAILLPAYIIDTLNLDHKFFINVNDDTEDKSTKEKQNKDGSILSDLHDDFIGDDDDDDSNDIEGYEDDKGDEEDDSESIIETEYSFDSK